MSSADLLSPGRKIALDTDIYCPVPHCEGGRHDCDHDYPPQPERDTDEWATWVCTRCDCKTTFEVWS